MQFCNDFVDHAFYNIKKSLKIDTSLISVLKTNPHALLFKFPVIYTIVSNTQHNYKH